MDVIIAIADAHELLFKKVELGEPILWDNLALAKNIPLASSGSHSSELCLKTTLNFVAKDMYQIRIIIVAFSVIVW